MNKFFFWNSFQKSDKWTFIFLLVTLICLCFGLIIVDFIDLDLVLNWKKQIDSESIPVMVDSFHSLLYNFNVEVNQYLLFKSFDSSFLRLKPWSWSLYLILYGISISLIGAAISTIEKRFYYFIAITIFCFLLLGLRFDALHIFNLNSSYSIAIVIIPLLTLSYYLHAFADHLGTLKRILLFLTLTFLVGIIIIKNSLLLEPETHLANYAGIGASVLSTLWILTISHDNIWLISNITGGANSINPKSNFYNFIILSFLYLLFPGLLFLKYQGHINIDLSYLNPWFLLITSTIVSIWSLKGRSILYKSIFRYDPVAKYLNLGLAIGTFSLIIFSFLTYNASFIIFFEKLIIFSHLSFGLIFFAYICINFIGPIMENYKIDKVIYEGVKLPYFSVGFTSIAMIFLIMWANHHSQYRQWLSGTFNLLGETELVNGSELLGTKFYETSLKYHNHNMKASYVLGEKAIKTSNRDGAEPLLNNAAKFSEVKNPKTYIKLANEYKFKNQGFNENWVLGDAYKEFPKSGEILTNKGLWLEKNNFLDSSFVCLKRAIDILKTDDNKSNAIGLLSKGNFKTESIADALFEGANTEHYPTIINLSALYNTQQVVNKIPFENIITEKNKTSTEQLAYIHNYTLNTAINPNPSLKKELEKLLEKLSNSVFSTDINFLMGYYLFYNGNKGESLKYFKQTMTESPVNLVPYYGLTIAQILSSNNYFDLAQPFIKQSLESQRFNPINQAPIFGVFNSIITNDTSQFIYASKLISIYDSVNQQILSEVKPIIYEASENELLNYTDRQKVMFAEARPELVFVSEHEKVLQSFENNDLKAQYIAASMDWFTKFNVPELNEYYWERLPKTELEESITNELNYQYLNMLSLAYRFNEIIDRIPTLSFNKNREKDIYRLLASAHSALKNNSEATKNYKKAIELDGLNPELLNEYSKYLDRIENKKEAYYIISTAIELYPNHININKTFCLQALKNGNYFIAEETLNDLSDLLNKSEFIDFKKSYTQIEQRLDQAKDW